MSSLASKTLKYSKSVSEKLVSTFLRSTISGETCDFNHPKEILIITNRGRSQFTFTVFSTFLTTHLPLIYNHLHLTNHLPTVNVYIWILTTPKQYVPHFVELNKEVAKIRIFYCWLVPDSIAFGRLNLDLKN